MSSPAPVDPSIRSLEDRADRELALVRKLTTGRPQAGVAREPGEHVTLIPAASLTPEPIRWLWPGWLARGKLHVLAGAAGTGKTTLALEVAACITSGRALPSGWKPERGHVLVWSGEDDPKDTLVPRLLAAGADASLVHFVGDVRSEDGPRPFDPAHDVDRLARACAGIDDIALLIIDPLVSAVAGDSHMNSVVRRGLAPLVDLAARLDAALLGITHYSKGTSGRDPLERVSGSLAFGALARVVLGTVRQQGEDETDRRLILARAKSNIGPDGGGFAYAFEQVESRRFPGVSASRIVWGAELQGTARELLAEPEPQGDTQGDAAAFLRELLGAGSMAAKTVFAEASAAGYSKDSMHRARRRIGAETFKLGMSGGWYWRMPTAEGGTEDSEGGRQIRPPSSPPLGAFPPSSGASDPAEVEL